MLLAALLLLSLGATLAVVQWNLKQDQEKRLESELSRARANLSSRLEQNYLLLETLAYTQEMNPSLRIVMNRTNKPTLESFLEDVRRESGVDMVLLTDLEGNNLGNAGYSKKSVAQYEGIELALAGESAVDYWLLPEGLHQVYSVPMVAGGLVDGTLSMGILLDADFLKSAAKETGVELLMLSGGVTLAGSFEADEKVQISDPNSNTLTLAGQEYRFRSLSLDGSNRAVLILLDDVTPSALLLQATRNQLLLIGGLTFLLALGFSWPLVEKVTVSSELLETVVEKVGEGLCQLKRDGTIVRVNPEAEKLFGLTQQELQGKSFSEMIKVGSGPLNLEEELRLEDVVIKTSKAEFPASLVATPFSSESGKSGIVVIVRDISHVKETEEKLRQAAQAKADFLAHMSHEIRTPMNGVLGMNSLLLATPLSQTQARYAQVMDSSGRALLEIINDVLDHSKLEAGAVRLESVPYDLWNLMEEVASLLALEAHKKGIDLFLFIDCETPNKVLGDPSRLRQILLNLVGNAIKFTSEGYVRLSVRPVESRLHFEVEDTGIGIRPEVQEQLFQNFSQAEKSTNRLYGGTGLGLFISERLVNLLGGRIQLESKLGEGSRFWFEIDQNQPIRERPEPLGPGRVRLEIQKEQRRNYVKALIESWGLNCHENPDEADVHVVDAHEGSGVPDPKRTVVLVGPGQKMEGTHYCQVPVRSTVLYSTIKPALTGELPEASGAVKIPTFSSISPDSPLVVVVDDNEINREVAEASLAQLGYRTLTAESGRDALKLLSETEVDAFLMDCEMPELDGYETSLRIRKTNPDVPIIALTAGVKAGSSEKLQASKMNSLLLKPFQLEELRDSLQALGVVPQLETEVPQVRILDHKKLEFLRTLREDNPNFVRELIAGYLERFEAMMESMESARLDGRWNEVASLAHKQRGAAGNLGAEALRRACQDLEEEPTLKLYETFRIAALEAKTALEEHLKKADKANE